MNRLRVAPLQLLLCALALLCALPLSASAADEPAIKKPRTYHYHSELAISIYGLAGTGVGDGDYDLERRAFRVVSTTVVEGIEIRLEQIVVEGKLFVYNRSRQRWEYIILTPEYLDQLFAQIVRVPIHPTASYIPDGSGRIGNDEVARWRASNDYNVLLASFTSRDLTGRLIEEVLTADVAIGRANGYLYRTVLQEEGRLTTIGGSNAGVSPLNSRVVATYSNFDQPVIIVAPEGAVPSPDQPQGLLDGGDDIASAIARALAAPRLDTGLAALLAGVAEP